MSYNVIPITDGIWTIEDGTVRMYLLDGGTEAVLIDTGFGSGDLLGLVKSLAEGARSGKITVVNTHFHGDHTTGNRQFSHFLMGEKEVEFIRDACPADADIQTVREGDLIRAGSVCLKVLDIPGHTPGSIALLDEKDRILFSADSVAKHFPVYMQFPGQSVENYLAALHKMKDLGDKYDRICPCHGELDVEKAYLDKMIHCCEGILDGSIKAGTCLNSNGTLERAYWFEDVAIFH